MTHIKKYWILYTLLTVGIILLIIWGMKRPPCNTGITGLGTCPTNFQLSLKRKSSIPKDGTPCTTPRIGGGGTLPDGTVIQNIWAGIPPQEGTYKNGVCQPNFPE